MGWLTKRTSDLISGAANGGNFSSYQELLDFLANIAKENSNKNVSDTQLDIYGKLFDQGLAYAGLKEQRDYDKPSAQLARLMQTGMSRDAALQLLNGSGGSGGSGGSPLIGASAPLVPSESELRGAQRADAISNIVINSLNTLANLANVGAQIPIYMQTAEGMAYQNQVQQQIMSAQESINQCYGVIQQALNDDVVKGELKEFVGNRSNTEKAVEGLAKRGFQPAIDFINNGGLKSLRDNAYSAGVAEQMYYNLARPEQYMTDSFMQNRMNQINYELSKINIDEVAQGILESYSRIENLLADTENKRVNTLFTEFQTLRGNALLPLEKKQAQANIGFTRSQTKLNYDSAANQRAQAKYTLGQFANLAHLANLYKSQTRLNNANAETIELQNSITSPMLNNLYRMPDGSVVNGRGLMIKNGLYDLHEISKELSATYGNSDWFNNRVRILLNSQEATAAYSAIDMIWATHWEHFTKGVNNNPIGGATFLPMMSTYYKLYNFTQLTPSQVSGAAPFNSFSGKGDLQTLINIYMMNKLGH